MTIYWFESIDNLFGFMLYSFTYPCCFLFGKWKKFRTFTWHNQHFKKIFKLKSPILFWLSIRKATLYWFKLSTPWSEMSWFLVSTSVCVFTPPGPTHNWAGHSWQAGTDTSSPGPGPCMLGTNGRGGGTQFLCPGCPEHCPDPGHVHVCRLGTWVGGTHNTLHCLLPVSYCPYEW